jgi:hypothetical protein
MNDSLKLHYKKKIEFFRFYAASCRLTLNPLMIIVLYDVIFDLILYLYICFNNGQSISRDDHKSIYQ